MYHITFYTPSGLFVPKKAHPTDIGYDLYAAEDIIIPPRSVAVVRNGIIAKVETDPQFSAPFHYYLQIQSRSGLASKGIFVANSPGLIDPTYCGPQDELKTLLYNSTEKAFSVGAGDRVSQLVVMFGPKESEMFVVRDLPEGNSRGGIGSTGMKG